MSEEDKVCQVCFMSMADLAAAQIAAEINTTEKEIDSEPYSDVSSEENSYKDYGNAKGMSVGSECIDCDNVICHECLIDWAITTIE